MTEVARPWTQEQLGSEAVTKKQVLDFLHSNASTAFLKEHKIFGKIDNVAKTTNKEAAVKVYNLLFETKAFRNEAEEAAQEKLGQQKQEATKSKAEKKEEKTKEEEKPRYTKTVIKAGNGKQFPTKGDTVSCRYKGTLSDGNVFDQNVEKVKGKAAPALEFKVGQGKVIRGWDEALLTMSVGEVAKIVVQPEWAYGKKGLPDAYQIEAKGN